MTVSPRDGALHGELFDGQLAAILHGPVARLEPLSGAPTG